MIFSAAPFRICVLSLIFVRTARTDGLLPESDIGGDASDFMQFDEESQLIEDEMPPYDWSPPDGQLPDDDVQQSLATRLNFEEKEMNSDAPKFELKRGFDFLRKKKNQVLCHVQKSVHHHTEPGYEFFPKSYTSYSCHPVGPRQQESVLALNHDTCYVTGNNCITVEKEQLFLKRRHNTQCWSHFIEAVGAGCKCLPGKYSNNNNY